MSNNLEFVVYNKKFLEKSWKWLNNLELKIQTNTPDFTKEDQEKWYLDLKNKDNYYIKGIICNNEEIGVVGLKNIEKNTGEYWGYIGEKKYQGKGKGKELINHIILVAKELNLDKIYLKVVKDNVRAIKLYEKMGFFLKEEKEELFIYEKNIL